MEKTISFLKKIIPRRIFNFFQPVYHWFLAFFAALFYGFPSRHLKVIGVTGTKGKTTVVELLHEILKEGGIRVASLSSLRFRVGDSVTINEKKMTMPGRFFTQKFLHDARRKKCGAVILEVTSEGIKQFRHRFINFDAAVMTNISPEHIESHGNFENYLRAKLDMFWRVPRNGVAIINADDAHFHRFSAATGAKKIFYSRDKILYKDSLKEIKDLKISPEGIEFETEGRAVKSSLLGEFNFYNILASIAVGMEEHINMEQIVKAVSRVSVVPGRMEFVQKEPFAVVVDYAHTPESLRQVYHTVKCQVSGVGCKTICVLGSAGGGRDKWKRPIFGKIASEFCDEIVLTNEDPYDENPKAILNEIAFGFSSKHKAQNTKPKIILDRRKAIREAIKSAKSGDMVVVTGKGAEPWIMGPRGKKTPWDDRAVTKEEIRKLKINPVIQS